MCRACSQMKKKPSVLEVCHECIQMHLLHKEQVSYDPICFSGIVLKDYLGTHPLLSEVFQVLDNKIIINM